MKANKKHVTAAESVLIIIQKSKKGVNSATLAEKTGFDNKKIANIGDLASSGMVSAVRELMVLTSKLLRLMYSFKVDIIDKHYIVM